MHGSRRGLKRLTDAASEPITLEDMKLFLRVELADEDALIADLIRAARQSAERYLGRALITQTWRLSLDHFPSEGGETWWEGVRETTLAAIRGAARAIALPYPPLQSVSAFVTIGEDDAESPFAASNYIVDTAREPGRIVLKTSAQWPVNLRAAEAVRIDYVAGYGASASDVPQAIRDAIRMTVAHWYEHREAGDLPQGATRGLESYRVRQI